MSRRFSVRPGRARGASLAVVASIALSAVLSPLLSSASAAPVHAAVEAPRETVVPPALRNTYTSASLFTPSTQTGMDGVGTQGVFHSLEGNTGHVWTRYADGKSIPVPVDRTAFLNSGTGSDIMAYRYNDQRVNLWDATDGTTHTFQVPTGEGLLGIYGTTGVAYRNVTADDGTTTHAFHLLTPAADGTVRDVPVTGLPPGTALLSPRAADGKSLLIWAASGGLFRMVAVDRQTGQVQGWTQPVSTSFSQARLSKDHVVLYTAYNAKVLVLPRSDLSATPAELVLDVAGSVNPAEDLAVVGDWVVHRPGAGTAVLAKPLAGGATVTVVGSSNQGVSSASDDSAVVVGRTTTDDWGIQRITPGADGRPVVTMVKQLPRPAARIQGLSLEQGRLVVTDPGSGHRDDYLRTVSPSGTPEFGARSAFTGSDVLISSSCPAQDTGCSAIQGTADGRIAWVEREGTSGDRLRVNGPGQYDLYERSVPAGGRITDVSGKYLIYAGAGQQYVYKLNDYADPKALAQGAAALSGDELLTAGSTPGSVTGFNLTTRTPTATLATDASCVPEELQAVGRWLYWSCGPGGPAGVYDRTAKKSVPVPSGEARLGDGYLVTYDKAAGELTLTTVTDGKAVSRVIGELPDTGVSQRDVRWTVDESGPNAAYVDAQEQVHLVPSGVPSQPLRLLAPAANAVSVAATPPAATPGTLTDTLLSKPSAGWTLTVRNTTGKVVDTEQGGAARGALSVGWHGNDRAFAGTVFFPDGRYDWSLSITPADGQGAPLTVTGTVNLTGGVAADVPQATVAPRITGTATVGVKLTATVGTWLPAPTSFGYQWKADGAAISGATESSYTVPLPLLDKKLTLTVTAHRTGHGDGTATTTAVTVAEGNIPHATVAPRIMGTVKVGATLNANVGAWLPAPTSFGYQWKADGAAISGATAITYTVPAALLDKKLTLTVIAHRPGAASTTATTGAVIVARGDASKVTTAPRIAGTAKVSSTLTAVYGTWAPAPTSYLYQWYANGKAISGATKSTFKLTAAQAGMKITLKVTAVRTGYTSGVASTTATATVAR